MCSEPEYDPVEMDLVLEAVQRSTGYDFRGYARPSIQRRLESLQAMNNLPCLADMIPLVLHDDAFREQLLRSLSITVTEMYRDPQFYRALREEVVPELRKLATIRVWIAGCATGEEAYSVATLLSDEGLYDRAVIYATDFNAIALQSAEDGIYPAAVIRTATHNYAVSGGIGCFSDYYHCEYGSVKMDDALKANLRFSQHNLATDGPFGDMDLILCRNVLIYFGRALQDRVFSLFDSCLAAGGYLCLGSKETLRLSSVSGRFDGHESLHNVHRHRSTGSESAPGFVMTPPELPSDGAREQ